MPGWAGSPFFVPFLMGDPSTKPAAFFRQGIVGDHMAHLAPEHWAETDRIFYERLGHIAALGRT